MQPDHRGSPGRAALLFLGSLALAAVIVNKTLDGSQTYFKAGDEACSSLLGTLPGQLCNSYHTAVGAEKFDAAVHWRQLSPETCKCCFWLSSFCARIPFAWPALFSNLGPVVQVGTWPWACCGTWHISPVGCCITSERHLRMFFVLGVCSIVDSCSGVTVECLHNDMRSSNASSSCRPLQEGEPCDEQQQQLTCTNGFCGGKHFI
jgi:hypothetical protein